MKVKQLPEDFRVEELTDTAPGRAGEFALYRLDKTGWTTPDALAHVRRAWKLDAGRVNYGGLKDRHAVTAQYLTVHRGPERDYAEGRIRLVYLGRVPREYGPEQIRANRFTIVLRHLTEAQVEHAHAALAGLETVGVPNYFDDQRFGSVTRDNEFVGREMVHGRFERALRLALAAPYEHDRAPAKAEKAILSEYWGRWAECKAALPRGHARSLVDYLAQHPGDFAGAVARLRPELGGLYLSAYQSYLWNRVLDRWLRARFSAKQLGVIALKVGDFARPRGLPPESAALAAEWAALELPLPSARLKVSTPEIDAVLAEEGLMLPRLRVPKLDRPYFSKGERRACVPVAGVKADDGPDAENRGRRALTLAFELPRGCYATMVVKCVTG